MNEKYESIGRIDGTPIAGSMVGIHIDGWITAARGALTVNGAPIVQATERFEFEPPGVRVSRLDDVRADWFGDKPPMIEWSEL